MKHPLRWMWVVGLSGLVSAEAPFELISEPVVLSRGELSARLGFSFARPYRSDLYGLDGNLFSAGAISLAYGFGAPPVSAEGFVDGVIQNLLWVRRRHAKEWPEPLGFAGVLTHNTGDYATGLRVFVPWRMLGRTDPAGDGGLGLKLWATLPNASNESGLGRDETDFQLWGWARLLPAFLAGRAAVTAGLGFSVFGNPLENGGQDDQGTWGTRLDVFPVDRWRTWVEYFGRSGDNTAANPPSQKVAFGLRWGEKIVWAGHAGVGLKRLDPAWFVSTWVTYTFQVIR